MHDRSQYLIRRNIPKSERAEVAAWLRERGWFSPGSPGRFFAPPEVVRAHGHEHDFASGVWCDFEISHAAREQARREQAATYAGRRRVLPSRVTRQRRDE